MCVTRKPCKDYKVKVLQMLAERRRKMQNPL
jgi:hypothetical protein